VSPGTHVVALTVSRWLSWCTYRGNIKHTSGGEDCPPDTSHLFSVFPPFPSPWNVAFLTCITMEFHRQPQLYVLSFTCIFSRCWYVLSFTCIFSRCCLQYASVLHRELTGFNFLYPETKRTPLDSKCDKTHKHSQQHRIRSFCAFYARQTIIN